MLHPEQPCEERMARTMDGGNRKIVLVEDDADAAHPSPLSPYALTLTPFPTHARA
jgi:hypothetical protein